VALFHLICFCVNLWRILYLRSLREHVAFGAGRWLSALGALGASAVKRWSAEIKIGEFLWV